MDSTVKVKVGTTETSEEKGSEAFIQDEAASESMSGDNQFKAGYKKGFTTGYDIGMEDAKKKCTSNAELYNTGYANGFEDGYTQAEEDLSDTTIEDSEDYEDFEDSGDEQDSTEPGIQEDAPFWDSVQQENSDITTFGKKPNMGTFWKGFFSAVGFIGLIVFGVAYVCKAISKRR